MKTQMNLMSVESMKPVLSTLNNAIQACFTSMEAEVAARTKSDDSTVDLAKMYTEEMELPAAEIVEKYESTVKELNLWPFTMKEKEKVFLGVVPAKAECLAARIRERLYQAVIATKPLLTAEGMLQFHSSGGRNYIKNEANTDADGNFTRGKGRGGKDSLKDIAKASGDSNPQQSNAADKDDADVNPVNTAEVAKQINAIEQAFGNLNTHAQAMRHALEAHRIELSKVKAGSAFLEDYDGHNQQLLDNLNDLAESLHMVVKDGKYKIKRHVA